MEAPAIEMVQRENCDCLRANTAHITSALWALTWNQFEHIRLEILSMQAEMLVDRVEIATGGQEP